MARGELTGQGGSRALARGANPWRPALRFELVETHDRHPSLCGHIAATLRSRLPQARFQSADDAVAGYDPVSPAAPKRRPAAPALAALRTAAEAGPNAARWCEGVSTRHFGLGVLVFPLTDAGKRWRCGQG